MLAQGVASCPRNPGLHLAYASALRRTDALEQALEQAEVALGLDGDGREVRLLHFALLTSCREWERAGRAADDVALIDPANPHLLKFWAKRASTRDDLRRLIGRCDIALAAKPGSTYAVWVKALALAKLGEDDAARALISTERGVVVESLGPAAVGDPDGDRMQDALAAEIRALPGLRPDPRGGATRGGHQTGSLDRRDGEAVARLIERIEEAAGRYRRAAGPAAPVCRLDLWAVVYGAGGRQRSHVHPHGWMSGVYFAAAPRKAPGGGFDGPLLIGAVEADVGIAPPWGCREIEPVPGRVVMFPSYVPHATRPAGGPGERVTLGFDLVPLDEVAE